MEKLLQIVEFIPNVLAVATAVFASLKFNKQQEKRIELITILTVVTCAVLLICQVSWFTQFIQGFDTDNIVIHVLWKIFDSLAMVLFVLIATYKPKQLT